MLGHQLLALPPIESFIDELAELFTWLEGVTERASRSPVVPYSAQEDTRWVPPPTVQTWGFTAHLKTIRFAAVNHLLVELGYGSSVRTIEPYSLRSTRAGNLILHSIRADSGEHRSYRVDRIESTRATNGVFSPKYAIEFASTGPMNAPPAYSTAVSARYAVHRRHQAPSYQYRIECPVCGKGFARSRPGNNKLNSHKTPDGYRCPGSGSYGYSV